MEEYLKQVRAAERKSPRWRYGQTLFNTLCVTHPELAEQIRGTELDPFHKKEGAALVPFWNFIRENVGP